MSFSVVGALISKTRARVLSPSASIVASLPEPILVIVTGDVIGSSAGTTNLYVPAGTSIVSGPGFTSAAHTAARNVQSSGRHCAVAGSNGAGSSKRVTVKICACDAGGTP